MEKLQKKRKNKVLYLIIVLLIVILLGTNAYWFYALKKEQEQLENAIIPTLTNDYFINQLSLTNNDKKYQDSFYEEYMDQVVYDEYYYNSIMQVYNSNPKDVPLINQNPNYPNGCEAAAATMLLNYYGIDITLQEFIDEYLVTSMVYEEDGKRYGPSPALYYVGDPSSKTR